MIIDTYGTFLRNDEAKKKLQPEIIIRFGAMPVSKVLTLFLKENLATRQVVVDGGVGWRDPAMLSTEMVYCNESIFCEELVKRVDSSSNSHYSNQWKKLNSVTKEILTVINETEDLSEGKIFYQLAEMLPEDATFLLGTVCRFEI